MIWNVAKFVSNPMVESYVNEKTALQHATKAMFSALNAFQVQTTIVYHLSAESSDIIATSGNSAADAKRTSSVELTALNTSSTNKAEGSNRSATNTKGTKIAHTELTTIQRM